MSRSRHGSAAQGFSQRTLLLLMAGLAIVGFVALTALVDRLQSRPVDLLQKTRAAADVIERALLGEGLQVHEVVRTEEETYEDERARWYSCLFDVTVPPTMDPVALRHRLVADLTKRNVGLMPEEEGEELRFLLAGCEFARVQLHVSEPPAAANLDPPLETAEPPAEPEDASPATPEPQPSPPDEPQPPLPEEAMEPPAPKEPEPVVEPTKADTPPVSRADSPRYKVAIIVDDGGYGGSTTEAILALDPKLTLAILPHTPRATATARRAAELGFEVVLHMPMEATEPTGTKLKPLTLAMTPEEIVKNVEDALAQVPGVAGVNNHEGSRFTGDTAAMTAFFSALKGRSLYYIDSLTSPLSVAGDTARSMGIPTATRDVFLDNERNKDYIRRQFDELLEKARERGSAIGICHFRADTANVLGELLDRMKSLGEFELVHASELVK